MAHVDFLHGDILEGGYDLTVFPSSAKGTVSSATKRKVVDVCGIELPPKMGLGDVSSIYSVNISHPPTKYIVYGASVLNDYSSFESVKRIARQLGEITQERKEITNIEAPLLGTGAGGLSDNISAKALKEGFEETAREDARLTVFMFGAERLEKVNAFLANPLAAKEYPTRAPAGLNNALTEYLKDANGKKTAFILMSFEETTAHHRIMKTIKDTCAEHDIIALRADDRQYADGLLDNILTYVYGCDFGIAVFERIRGEVYNPNVSFEAGFLMGLQKPLLYLKDETLTNLPTDLVGNLYKPFDFLDPEGTLPDQITSWLRDKKFI